MDTPSSYQVEMSSEEFHNLELNIGSNIQKISQNVSSITKMVSQLQTAQDTPQLRNDLRHVQTYTQQLARDTSHMLKKIMRENIQDNMVKLARDRLRDEYMSTLNAFQAVQRSAAQKSKADIMKTKAQFVTISSLDPPNTPNVSEGSRQLQEQMNAHRQEELDELEERERDIRNLERDIMDVNQIFKDLGTMVHDQGQFIDSIELNVESTANNVHSGTEELRQAAGHKNKLRKRKIVITVVAVLVICILGIIFFSK